MTALSRWFRGLCFLLILPLLTALLSIIALADRTLLRRDPARLQSYPRLWARIICRIAGVRVKIIGGEHLDPKATYVFAGNHASQFDIYGFQAAFPHDFRWIAKKELFAIPIMGRAMRAVGFIAIDRSRGRAAVKSLALAARRITEGSSVLIFPEGTRSPDGRLHPFKSGAFVLAIKSGVEVVPLGFNNTSVILPKGSLMPRPGEMTIRIGAPISTRGLTAKDKQQLAEKTHKQVAALLDARHLPAGDQRTGTGS